MCTSSGGCLHPDPGNKCPGDAPVTDFVFYRIFVFLSDGLGLDLFVLSSLCSPVWPGTNYIDQSGLGFARL